MASLKNEAVETLTTKNDHMNFLRCFICNRSYTSPKLLPCLHSFCLTCLENSCSDVTCLLTDEDCSDVSTEDNPMLPPVASITCPMCKTQAPLPKLGVNGFKDNLLVIEMIRRWEEKLCENEPVSNRVSPKNSPQKNGTLQSEQGANGSDKPDMTDDDHCTCLPLWKNISNGKVISEKKKIGSPNLNQDFAQESDSKIRDSNYLDYQFFCVTCDVMICVSCRKQYHIEHHTVSAKEATADRHEYLDHLLTELSSKSNECETSMLQVQNCAEHIVTSADQIVQQIEERSKNLIRAIEQQKEHLLEELTLVVSHNKQKSEVSKSYLQTHNEKLKTAFKFTRDLLDYGSGSDLMYLTNDVSDRLHELIKQKLMYHKTVANVRLEVPEIGYDDNHFHKLFGSLKQSEVKCGSAELLQSFDLDLKWPTGMAATLNRDFVVTGKMGAFEEKGKVMFFTRSGSLKTQYELDERCIPYDTTVTNDGHVLVADNGGNIHKFDSAGRKLDTMAGKFEGVGRLASIHRRNGHFVITSSGEQKVKVFNHNGDLQMSLPKDGSGINLDHPHYVATNKLNDIIVSDFKQHAVFAFDACGNLRFKYSGNGIDAGELKCPSAVCCDNFNNILVADFMNDRVHMLSPSGQFLGYLLTKENSITCPNFLSTDGDGHLYVGQYGGQIQVFQYMGYLKFV